MPPTLFVQMDNCARENKNKTVFGFLGLMIAKDLVKDIESHFLMTGHSHNGTKLFHLYLNKDIIISF